MFLVPELYLDAFSHANVWKKWFLRSCSLLFWNFLWVTCWLMLHRGSCLLNLRATQCFHWVTFKQQVIFVKMCLIRLHHDGSRFRGYHLRQKPIARVLLFLLRCGVLQRDSIRHLHILRWKATLHLLRRLFVLIANPICTLLAQASIVLLQLVLFREFTLVYHLACVIF